MLLRTVREQASGLTKDQKRSFTAAFLGWSMDAFDYFIVILVYADIAKDFHVSLTKMAFLTTVTLAARPFGAFLFGRWADKVGRRKPLIACVIFYSIIGFACAFVPNFQVLLILRLLYGLGMGGEWGLGAALAMEKIPISKRGFFSGLLQQGYAVGFMAAALAYLVINPLWGWRGLFAFSFVPAMIVLFVQLKIEESEVWKATRERAVQTRTTVRQIFSNPVIIRRFLYLVLLMTAFNWMSHGTQDIYPTFLKAKNDGGMHLSGTNAIFVALVYNVGAIVGGMIFGAYSERLGRRRAIMLAAGLALPVVPLFAYSPGLATLVLGAFMMQFFVQGAWGVIPAHLSEMSPDEIRGFYPGVTYQLGNLIASLNLPIQQRLAASHSYPFALAVTIAPVLLVVIVVIGRGKENKGTPFAGQVEAPAIANSPRSDAPLTV
jgi:MFS transporter, SHS family, lactate transporter